MRYFFSQSETNVTRTLICRLLVEVLCAKGIRFLGFGLLMLSLVGCAAWRQNHTVSLAVAKGRELTQTALLAFEIGDLGQAEKLLRNAVKASPEAADSRRHLAETLWKSGDYQGAIENMQAAEELDSTDAEAKVQLGKMLYEVGLPEAAFKNSEAAIRINPELASAWYLRGKIYSSRQKPRLAINDYHRALKYSPNDPLTLFDLALIYHQEKDHQQCLTTVQYLLESNSEETTESACFLEGICYSKLARPHDAARCFLAMQKRFQTTPELLYQIANAKHQLGEDVAAQTIVRQALAMDQSHVASRKLFGNLTRVAVKPIPTTQHR